MAENPTFYTRFSEAYKTWAEGAVAEREKFPAEQVKFPIGFVLTHKLLTGETPTCFEIQKEEESL